MGPRMKPTGLSGGSLSAERVAGAFSQIADFTVVGKTDLPVEAFSLDDIATAWAAQASSPGKKIVVRP